MGHTTDLDQMQLDSVVVMPVHASSVMLGRHVVLAWLQLASQEYDIDTALLLVTELLRHAVVDADGPLVISVGAHHGAMRFELRDAPAASGPPREGPSADPTSHLRMVSALADRWGVDLDLSDDAPPSRVSWFECAPVGGRPRPKTTIPRARVPLRIRQGPADG